MRISALLLALPSRLMGCVPRACAPPVTEPMPSRRRLWRIGLAGLWSDKAAKKLEVMRFAKTVRIIRPGMAVTMDYSAERLNIEINAGRGHHPRQLRLKALAAETHPAARAVCSLVARHAVGGVAILAGPANRPHSSLDTLRRGRVQRRGGGAQTQWL